MKSGACTISGNNFCDIVYHFNRIKGRIRKRWCCWCHHTIYMLLSEVFHDSLLDHYLRCWNGWAPVCLLASTIAKIPIRSLFKRFLFSVMFVPFLWNEIFLGAFHLKWLFNVNLFQMFYVIKITQYYYSMKISKYLGQKLTSIKEKCWWKKWFPLNSAFVCNKHSMGANALGLVYTQTPVLCQIVRNR